MVTTTAELTSRSTPPSLGKNDAYAKAGGGQHQVIISELHPGEPGFVVGKVHAEQFAERVGYDGVVLTKLDGDARGGAALSVKAVTGVPIGGEIAVTGDARTNVDIARPGGHDQSFHGSETHAGFQRTATV